MKVVLNICYGGFSLPEEFCKKYNLAWYSDIKRTDPRLITFVEENPELCQHFNFASLTVVEIPENVTDWQIHDYDGMESIIAVINGKIVWL